MPAKTSFSLFWRAFLFLTLLLLLATGAWLYAFLVIEREPRAEQIGNEVASIVKLTRAAVVHADLQYRRALLLTLAQDQGVRIVPLESSDKVEPMPTTGLSGSVTAAVMRKLPEGSLLSSRVNDDEALWVSFDIEGDAYWVRIDRKPIELWFGARTTIWLSATVLMSLLGAAVIVWVINRPLQGLEQAATQLSRGQMPEPLPDSGPREIQTVNNSFNHMVQELGRAEAERRLMLAGISHDLRTPLARLRLELEMSPLSDEARQGAESDIAQMDHIIGQFLDLARSTQMHEQAEVSVEEIASRVAQNAARSPHIDLTVLAGPATAMLRGDSVALSRALQNLVDNAGKYGKSTDGRAHVTMSWTVKGGWVTLQVRDFGPGIADKDKERLLQPFTRGDVARSNATGAGLGLAIVRLIVERHGGNLFLDNAKDGGLQITLQLPAAPMPMAPAPKKTKSTKAKSAQANA